MIGEARTMTVLRIAVTVAVLGTAAACAYHSPSEPTSSGTTSTANATTPTQLTLGTLPGNGAQGGTATVTARVQSANGTPVPDVPVTFTTSFGAISPTRVLTGVDGRATATLFAEGTAEVTASAAGLSAQSLVAAQAPVVTTTPTPTPAPTPTPSPTPVPPAVVINVSGSATTGVPLAFGVSSSATGVTWNWAFGDGGVAQTTAFGTTHAYAKAGVYTATVSALGTSTASATITVTDPVAPAPTPAAALAATLTCTPGTHGTTATACNVTLTYGGAALPSGSVTNVAWDWGDSVTTTSTTAVSTHTYANAGTYTVFATVTANTVDGSKTSPAASKSIVVP